MSKLGLFCPTDQKKPLTQHFQQRDIQVQKVRWSHNLPRSRTSKVTPIKGNISTEYEIMAGQPTPQQAWLRDIKGLLTIAFP